MTRLGSWVKAAEYYSKNYQNFTEFVNLLIPKESADIQELQEILSYVCV